MPKYFKVSSSCFQIKHTFYLYPSVCCSGLGSKLETLSQQTKPLCLVYFLY